MEYDLIKALRGELIDCDCAAHSYSECCCASAIWPEQVTGEAADTIESLHAELTEVKQAHSEKQDMCLDCEKELIACQQQRDELVEVLKGYLHNPRSQRHLERVLEALAKVGAGKTGEGS